MAYKYVMENKKRHNSPAFISCSPGAKMSKLQLKATALYLLYNLELTFKLNPKIIWDECQEAKTEVKGAIFMQY